MLTKKVSASLSVAFTLLAMPALYSQSKADSSLATKLQAAREIIREAGHCALITMDENNVPQVRTMDAFLPDDDFTIWLATNPKSRKVSQINANSSVVVFYNSKNDNGYVSVHGKAELINDKQARQKYWKEGWEKFYANRDDAYLLIRIKPDYLELINYKRGISGDSVTWQPTRVNLRKP